MTISFTETFSSFTPSATGWQDYDLYTNKGVPTGAIAHIAIASYSSSTDVTVGVRTDGSSLNRYIKLSRVSISNGNNIFSTYVKCDSSTGKIEIYSSSTSKVNFYLLGYWEGVDYTELFTQITTSTTFAWTDSDVYTNQSIPKGSAIDVCLAHYDDVAANYIGIRTDASSLDRRLYFDSLSLTASDDSCISAEMLVKSNI